MSADEAVAETDDGLTLIIALGGLALLVFILGIGVIYYLSYLQ